MLLDPHTDFSGGRSGGLVFPAGAAAVRHWSDFKEIPHIQGQRRSPNKIGRRGKIVFRIKPLPI